MRVSVQMDYQQALRTVDLDRKRIQHAAAVAINRTANTGRALMARRIRERRKLIGGLRVSDIKENIAIERASPSKLFARLMMFGGKHIPLSEYRHQMTKQGFMVNVIGEGMKRVIDYQNKGFVNPALRGGEPSIRMQPSRTPTKMLRGPTLASAVTSGGWQKAVLAPQLMERFRVLLAQQIRFQLSKR